EEILRLAGGLSVRKRNKDNFVPGVDRTVPAAVLADERAAAIVLRQERSAVEKEPEGRCVRAQRVVGHEGLGDEIGSLILLLDAPVDVCPPVGEWPAIEAAVFDVCEVIWNEIVAEEVALIDDGPKRAGFWLDVEAVGIAKAAGEHTLARAVRVD